MEKKKRKRWSSIEMEEENGTHSIRREWYMRLKAIHAFLKAIHALGENGTHSI